MGILEGALFVIAGFLLRQFFPNLKKNPALPRPPRPVEPICGCGHHLAYHDKKSGRCNHYQSGIQHKDTGSLVNCYCRQYTGPVPLESTWVPDYTTIEGLNDHQD